MILVDTSIWIDHLYTPDPRLAVLLERVQVGVHPMIVAELALGSIARRAEMLALLGELLEFPILGRDEVLLLVERRRLWGRGLSLADVHLLGAVALLPGARLWTRDKRLAAACTEVGVPLFD